MSTAGCLWVVATPIGNLGDLSPRARDLLPGLFLLACEQKSSAQRLFQALKLRCPNLLFYREEQHAATTERILEALGQGHDCGLVCDAGTPTLSDPGWRLVAACHEAGFSVRAVPGPSSLTAAISVAGLPAREFFFAGFPPSQRKARQHFFESLSQRQETCLLLVAPHDLALYLQELHSCCGGQRRLAISRELTKMHEETHLRSLDDWLASPPTERGELVWVLEGCPSSAEEPADDSQARAVAAFLLNRSTAEKDVRDLLTEVFKVPRNRAYKICLDLARAT